MRAEDTQGLKTDNGETIYFSKKEKVIYLPFNYDTKNSTTKEVEKFLKKDTEFN